MPSPASIWRTPLLPLLVLLLLFLPGALAQEGQEKRGEKSAAASDALILAAIDKGRTAYQKGDAQEAIRNLQEAVRLIQAVALKGLVSFLPDLGEEWEADEPNTTSGSWNADGQLMQWTQVVRQYRHKKSSRELSVSICNAPHLVEAHLGLAALWKNPAMRKALESDPDNKTKMIEGDGWFGLLSIASGESTNFTTGAKEVLITLDYDAPDAAFVQSVWEKMDHKGLAATGKPAEAGKGR